MQLFRLCVCLLSGAGVGLIAFVLLAPVILPYVTLFEPKQSGTALEMSFKAIGLFRSYVIFFWSACAIFILLGTAIGGYYFTLSRKLQIATIASGNAPHQLD